MSFEGLLILILSLMFTSTVASTFSPSPYLDVCPGGVAEFTCTVEDDGTTLWLINETAIDCTVFHRDAPVNRSCGPFHLTLNPPVGISYTSVLSNSSVSLALNNTEVQCRGPSNLNIVGNSSLRIIAPPTAPSFLPLSHSDFTGLDSSLQVTLHWTAPVVYPQPSDAAAVSRYVITSDQAGTCAQGGCVVSPSGPGFSQREYTLGNLPLSQDYTFTVRADNCEMRDNFQTGMESDGLVLYLQLPAMPACGSVPVYDSNDQLVSIETNWTTVVAPVREVAPNVSGDVANYVLRIAEVAQSTEVLDPSQVCGVSGCSYCVNNTFAGDSGQYTVILQARNIVGTGLQGQCGTIIGYENNLLKVSVDMSVPEGQLQCTFLSGFSGSARCRIEYFLQTISGIVESTEFGSEGDTVPVDLDLLLNAEYTYTATLVDANAGTTPVVVMGTFTTQCVCNGTAINATNDNCGENTVARDSNTSVVITAATVSAVVAFIIGALLGGLTHLCYPTKKKTSQITLETAQKASRYESNELQVIEELPQDSVRVESSPDDVEYANVQPIHRDAIELNANLAYRNLRRQNQ